MSIFNINNVPKEEKKSYQVLPEGKYSAKIVKVESKKTKQNHKALNLHLKTDMGIVFHLLNFDHPSCQQITQQSVAKILASYENPPTEVSTLEDLSNLIKGLPVEIFVKHKGLSDNGFQQTAVYFNDVPQEKKVKLEGGAPKKRVEY